MTASKRIEYENMPAPKEGVYLSKHGKFKVVTFNEGKWEIEEGKFKRHPFMRTKSEMIAFTTGLYFINKILYGCEYLGELYENVENRNSTDNCEDEGILCGLGDRNVSKEQMELPSVQ